MQNNPQLPPGFITVEDAIALIKKDRREEATVDLQFLVNNLPYLQAKHNYNIRLLKTVTDENGQRRVVRDGSVYVTLYTEYDKQILLRAITDAYKERTNIALSEDAVGVNKVTSLIDEEKQNLDARVRLNESSKTKVGDDISKPYEAVIEE